jgi:parallel beta-helix repeat protein
LSSEDATEEMMKKASLLVAIVVLMSTFLLTVTILPEDVRATTLYVGGTNPGNYTTIQDAINASFPGDTIYVYNGTYNEHVVVNKTVTLIGEDRNMTIINGGGTGVVLNVTADWANITGFTITNSGTSSLDAGIQLYYVQNCDIANNTVVSNFFGIHSLHSGNNTITNTIALSNQVGIRVDSSSNNTIVKNNASDNSYGFYIDFSNNNAIVKNNVSSNTDGIWHLFSDNNTLLNNTVSHSALGFGIVLGDSHDNIISNNTATNNSHGISFSVSNNNRVNNNNVSLNSVFGIYNRYSNGNVIANNNASWASQDGIFLDDSSNVTVVSNVMAGSGMYMSGDSIEHWNTHTIDDSNTVNGKPVYYWKNVTGGTIPSGAGQVILANCTGIVVENQDFTNGSVGVELGFSSYGTIKNNNVSSNTREGIYIWFSDNNTISDNTLSRNGDSIYMQGSNDNTIANNTISFNSGGVYVKWSINNSFANNNITSNDGVGISLGGANNNTISNNTASSDFMGISLSGSNNNSISNNTASWNSVYGLSLVNSDNNIIANNTASMNGLRGIFIELSDSNRIYHNNIIGNAQQAFDNTGANEWDDGYPNGGNYWSDYTGVDLFRGPNQDQTGKDGIGDAPYSIEGLGDDEDSYPLMYSVGWIGQPRNITANLTGSDWSDVDLQWNLSLNDGIVTNSIIRYEILRSTGFYDPSGNGYQLVASVPNGTSSYIDPGRGEGDPEDYFYIVCAVDSWDSAACTDDQAAKFTRPLSEGPNLVSIPLIQSDESIETALQTVSFDKAWFYEPLTKMWKSFIRSKPYAQDLEYLNHSLAFWVNVTIESNLTVAGIVPRQTDIQLHEGWNLVGFPCFQQDYAVGDLKVAVSAERIEGFDALASPYFLRLMLDGDNLQTGFGYWVKAVSETTWTVADS